jgi:hypothetical protein
MLTVGPVEEYPGFDPNKTSKYDPAFKDKFNETEVSGPLENTSPLGGE